MKGLIWKDFLVSRKLMRTYLIFLLVYTGMAGMGIFDVSVVNGMLCVIIMMLPVSVFALDETARWDRYAVCLPGGRKQAVLARYAFTVILFLATAAVGFALTVLGNGQEDLGSAVVSLLVIYTVGLVQLDVMLPLCYRFGAERARPFAFAVLVVPVLLLLVVARFGGLSFLNRIREEQVLLAAAGAFLVPLAGLPVSYGISCRIAVRKDY